MKIKSTNEASLLWTIGWLILSLLLIVAIKWFFIHTQQGNLISSSPLLSTTISKNHSKKIIPKKTFREILETHQDETILLSVKDEASNKFTENYRSLVQEMGGEKLAAIAFREAYTGIIQKGEFIEEKLSKSDTLSTIFNNYQVVSVPIPAGNYNLLIVEKDTFIRDARGLHAFVINEVGKLTNAYSFDFYDNPEPESAPIYFNIFFEELPQFTIELSEKKFKKFQKKRDQALKDGILITEEEDEVRGSLRFNEESYPIDIRLKGDWTDHLIGDKWSFRIHLDSEDAIMGMQKFSLHHPKARNYVGEWLFHQVLEDQGLVNLRYEFVQLMMTVKTPSGEKKKNLGVYAIEEFFGKQLIENNERRAGVLLKIDESLIWKNRLRLMKNEIWGNYIFLTGISDYQNLEILPFSKKTILKDSTLSSQFSKASTLLKGYLRDSLSFSDVFDVELMAKYNAVCNLFGAWHAMTNHNLRFYYNPVTARLEPVGFDANGFHKQLHPIYFDRTKKDLKYMSTYAKAMQSLLTDEYYEKILSWPSLDRKIELMKIAFPEHTWKGDPILNFNRQIIKSTIDPISSLTVFLNDYDGKNITLTLENYGELPIAIEGLTNEGNRNLGNSDEEIILLGKEQKTVSFRLDKNFQRLFVNKKKKRAGFTVINDIEKIKVGYRILGIDKIKKQSILPWSNEDPGPIANDLLRRPGNVASFPFLETNEQEKKITCKLGNWEIDRTLIVPKGYTFQINAGSTIDLTETFSKIISFSPIRFIGAPNLPVRILSKEKKGRGILVMNSVDTSIVKYCEFDKLSNPIDIDWSVSGAVNFYNAPVHITHTSFTNNRSEDALNIIKTNFMMDNVVFSDTQSDAFDGDFVNGTISNTLFSNLGNDAIDVSGSKIDMNNIVIKGAGDKGLSAGENSTMTGNNIKIFTSEIAVASKDNSNLNVSQLLLDGNKLCFTAFQKKPEFGPASLEISDATLTNNSLDHLIQNNSTLQLNGQRMPTVDRVKDQMYGVIYGKSTN
jgi:hypothetical protein